MSNDLNSMVSSTTRTKMEMLERARDAQERREKLAEALSSFINSADSDELTLLANSLACDHRTLVQRKFGFFLQFCKVLDSNYRRGNYDTRNEYACKTASRIMSLTLGIAEVPNV